MARFPQEPGWRKNDILSQLHLDSIINQPGCPPRPSSKITIRTLFLFVDRDTRFSSCPCFVWPSTWVPIARFFFVVPFIRTCWIENCMIRNKIDCEFFLLQIYYKTSVLSSKVFSSLLFVILNLIHRRCFSIIKFQ